MKPRYQDYQADDIPVAEKDGASGRASCPSACEHLLMLRLGFCFQCMRTSSAAAAGWGGCCQGYPMEVVPVARRGLGEGSWARMGVRAAPHGPITRLQALV